VVFRSSTIGNNMEERRICIPSLNHRTLDLCLAMVRSSEASPSTDCLRVLLSQTSMGVSLRLSWATSRRKIRVLAIAMFSLMFPTLFCPQASAAFLKSASSLRKGSTMPGSHTQASFTASSNPSNLSQKLSNLNLLLGLLSPNAITTTVPSRCWRKERRAHAREVSHTNHFCTEET
jgi:hypothetical protein